MNTNDVTTDYSSFLDAPTRKQWEKMGLVRRSGVSLPLFSIYSKKSTGIGDLHDLKLLVDWCKKTGMSMIQLLPMNDVGFDFRPYDAQSTFALEPAYLSLSNLKGISSKRWAKEILSLRKKYPIKSRVDYRIKQAKLDLLWQIFESLGSEFPEGFKVFRERQRSWLDDYALYKALKDEFGQQQWELWAEPFKYRHAEVMRELMAKQAKKIEFHQWMQWQLDEQFQEAKKYANDHDVYLMGDLPFLVSRDSADVWAHQHYFKLDRVSGAPPDAYFALGQRWGMPPYQWSAIEHDGFHYVHEKLSYAERFYDMFRIDHVVGMFRLWTIAMSEPHENCGLHGSFDPAPQHEWEEHGRKLLMEMVKSTKMLPCAEDLGVVPDCSYKVLREMAIPGMDVQRWSKESDQEFAFKKPSHYRKNSIAVISSHDMSSFRGWWMEEADTVDEILFDRKCREMGLPQEALKPQLFDLERSRYQRLRWREDIASEEILLNILGRPREQVSEILGWYGFSYQEKRKFWDYAACEPPVEEDSSPMLVHAALEKVSQSASIFSVQLLTDWLSLDPSFKEDAWKFRINFPGISHTDNWSIVMPFSLEKMKRLEINSVISSINESSKRI